jgi:hypothetical protein
MKPVRTSAMHTARGEMAVTRYSSALWDVTAKALDTWVRVTLRRINPQLKLLIRANDLETILISSMIGNTRVPVPKSLTSSIAALPKELVLQFGFLPRDPRAKIILAETKKYLDDDIGAYWRNLTDPTTLAREIAKAREGGMTGAQLATQISAKYRASSYAAERLVRTTYNTSANRAQFEALKATGYTSKKWATARDSRVRRPGGRNRFNHAAMNNVIVPIDQLFVTPTGSRMMYPGDRSLGAPTGDVINCRCAVIGVMINQVFSPAMDRQSGIPYNIINRPLETRPDGVSLETIISVPDGQDFDEARRALDIVRRIHGDGRIPPISVKEWRFADHPAALEYDENDDGTIRPREIKLSFGLEYSAHDVIHEIGHLLDFAIGRTAYGSQSNHLLLRQWRDAVENTATIQRLRALDGQKTMIWRGQEELIDQEEITYLLNPTEMFARTYAEFIASVSNDLRIKSEIGERVSHSLRKRQYPRQWNNDEFEPIALAFKQLFARLGWVR